jgi:hypothetical protein
MHRVLVSTRYVMIVAYRMGARPGPGRDRKEAVITAADAAAMNREPGLGRVAGLRGGG